MAQGFVIGMVALGAGLAILQRERSSMAAAQAAHMNNGPTGVTMEQSVQPVPSTGGAFEHAQSSSSLDGTIGGSTSTTPSASTIHATGIGAIAPSEDCGSCGPHGGVVPPMFPKPPESGSTSASTSAIAPEPEPVAVPRIGFRDYLLATTYGMGQTVTKREESDNLSAVGPSVGAIW